jgi:hypothetical protein
MATGPLTLHLRLRETWLRAVEDPQPFRQPPPGGGAKRRPLFGRWRRPKVEHHPVGLPGFHRALMDAELLGPLPKASRGRVGQDQADLLGRDATAACVDRDLHSGQRRLASTDGPFWPIGRSNCWSAGVADCSNGWAVLPHSTGAASHPAGTAAGSRGGLANGPPLGAGRCGHRGQRRHEHCPTCSRQVSRANGS